ncbi:hypothetical protein [Pseudomonas aeruginosa]|uniref:hypothetical protein n=1 Tax=Pseudomonas aeruginosa TaxID=287 RepID=UPI001EDDA602|nr:hypothetical protein [Pseudomonas aeruginosa]
MVDQVQLNLAWYATWMPKLKGEFEAFNLEIPRHQTELDDLLSIKVEKGIPVIDKGRTKDLESASGKASVTGRRHFFGHGRPSQLHGGWRDRLHGAATP